MSLYQDKFGHMRACIWTYRHMYGHHHWTYMHLEIFGRLGHTRIYPDTVVATHGQGRSMQDKERAGIEQGRRRDGARKDKERAGTERGRCWHGAGSTSAAKKEKGKRGRRHTVRDDAGTERAKARREQGPNGDGVGMEQEARWQQEKRKKGARL